MPSKLLASTSTRSKFLIIIAHSARALAESAARADYQVVTVDGFADLDTLHASIECWCLPLVYGEFSNDKMRECLTKVHARYPIAKVILGAGAEPYVRLLESVDGWDIYGNSSSCIEQLRDPEVFFAALEKLSISYPRVCFQSPPELLTGWLSKISASCGGMGVRRSSGALDRQADCYWQKEIIDAIPISALCLSDDSSSQVIGISQQFTHELTTRLPYVYSGALANLEISYKTYEKIVSYVRNIIDYFKIRGLSSVDMLVHDKDVFVLEVNPRVSATYELYERLRPEVNLIDAHLRVCEGERLLRWQPLQDQNAYLIAYADENYVVPDHIEWPDWTSDRPEQRRCINVGEPICSVHALGAETEDLYGLVLARYKQVLSYLK